MIQWRTKRRTDRPYFIGPFGLPPGGPERGHFLYRLFFLLFIYCLLCFVSMYSVLNKFSEYIYLYISKNITSYTYLIVLKIVESSQCILKNKYTFTSYQKTFHIDYQPISQTMFLNIFYIYHKMGVTSTYFWYISWSPNSQQPLNHLTPRIYDTVPSL